LLQQRDEERYIGTGRQKRARDEQRVRVMREGLGGIWKRDDGRDMR
jgi:hypothetical protein